MSEEIEAVRILPMLPPASIESLEVRSLGGALASFRFGTHVFLTEGSTVETISEITFHGVLDLPEEWAGLPVKGWVKCKRLTEGDLQYSDGQIALGDVMFIPARSEEKAFLQARHMGTPEFFQTSKALLEGSTACPRFRIELLDNARLLSSDNHARATELVFTFADRHTEQRPSTPTWKAHDWFKLSQWFLLAGTLFGVCLPVFSFFSGDNHPSIVPLAIAGLGFIGFVIIQRIEAVLEQLSNKKREGPG